MLLLGKTLCLRCLYYCVMIIMLSIMIYWLAV